MIRHGRREDKRLTHATSVHLSLNCTGPSKGNRSIVENTRDLVIAAALRGVSCYVESFVHEVFESSYSSVERLGWLSNISGQSGRKGRKRRWRLFRWWREMRRGRM